jgi:hypothetical protein
MLRGAKVVKLFYIFYTVKTPFFECEKNGAVTGINQCMGNGI